MPSITSPPILKRLTTSIKSFKNLVTKFLNGKSKDKAQSITKASSNAAPITYADRFIRGITDKNHVDGEIVSAAAFYFKYEDNNLNTTEQYEQSINWYDNSHAMSILMSQKREKDGEIQFKEGALVVPLESLNEVCKLPIIKGNLQYERKTIPGNDYHGNLLLHKSVSKKLMTLIAGDISLRVSEIIPNHEYQQNLTKSKK